MKIYSNLKTKKTYMEFWGASTKHPDVSFCYQYDIENGDFYENEMIAIDWYSFFQWVIFRLSTLSFGTLKEAEKIIGMARDIYPDSWVL